MWRSVLVVWTAMAALAVLTAVTTVTATPVPAARLASAMPKQKPELEQLSTPTVFCSRTQVQETAVRQRLLDSGQLMVSTHVLTSLRVGETVCISAALPEPDLLSPNEDDDEEPSARHAEARLFNIIHDDEDNENGNEDDRDDEQLLVAVGDELSALTEVTYEDDQTVSQGAANPTRVEDKSEGRRDSQHADSTRDYVTRQPVYPAVDQPVGHPAGAPAAVLDWPGRRLAREARLPPSTPAAPARLRRVLLPPSPPPEQRRLQIQLTLESVQHQHAITSSYSFSDPRLSVTCSCACASMHTCGSCGPLCVSKVSRSPAADCQGSFMGSARTCCQLKVKPGAEFQAVQLQAGVTMMRLRVAVTEEGGGRPASTESLTVEAQLGEDLRLDLNATQLRLSSGPRAGGSADLVRGWYVLHDNQLYQPQSINQLNEYSLHKLGWLKKRGDEHLMPSDARLAAAVHVTTDSCTEQIFQVQGDLLLDSTLPQLGHPLAGLTVEHQTPTHLLLSPERPGRPLQLDLDLRHLQQLRYLVHRARLADFDGELRVDARGAVLAELRLFNGSGVQHGSLEASTGAAGGVGGAAPAPYRFSLVAERRLRLRLPVTLPEDQKDAKMCLRPEGSAEAALCRRLPISRQPPERLHRDTGPDTQLTVDGQTNSINNMERFLRALNPATWLQSGASWTTGFGVVVHLIMLIVIITIICKCVKCFRAACCCCSRRDQKA